MHSKYSIIYYSNRMRKKSSIVIKSKKEKLNFNTVTLKTKNNCFQELTEYILLLLSFKESNTQNLSYILKLLGIMTIDDKNRIIKEIFRLIREGIVYIPNGLPQLIDQGLNNFDNVQSIDLCLLKPYDILIKEVQDKIAKLRNQNEEKK